MCHCRDDRRTLSAIVPRAGFVSRLRDTLRRPQSRCDHDLESRDPTSITQCSVCETPFGNGNLMVESSPCRGWRALIERVAEVLWRAAAAAARSVHAVRLGSAVGPFDAAQARRGAGGAEAHSRADAGRDVARAAEEARSRASRSPDPTARTGCRRCAPASSLFRRSPRSAGDDPRPAARRRAGRSSRFRSWARPARTACCCSPPTTPILPVDARVNRVGSAARLRRRRPAISRSRRARSRRRSTRELPASVDAYRRAFLYLSHHGGADVHGSATRTVAICPLLKDCPEGQKRAWLGWLQEAISHFSDRRCSVQRSHSLAERLDVLPDLLVLFALLVVERATDGDQLQVAPADRGARRKNPSGDTRAGRGRAARRSPTGRPRSAGR